MKNAPLLLLVVMLLGLTAFGSGCASIVSKSVYPVHITSEPSEADFVVYNDRGQAIHRGRTPDTVELEAGSGYFQKGKYTVTASKIGWMDSSTPIKQGVDGWYIAGNLFLGGLIGWLIVDPATGAMWTVKDAHICLQPDDSIAVSKGQPQTVSQTSKLPNATLTSGRPQSGTAPPAGR